VISAGTSRILLSILLAGLLTATGACSLVAKMRGSPTVKPAPTEVRAPVSEVVPVPPAVAADAEPELTVTSVKSMEGAATAGSESTAAERPSNSADDPRAVIDWLLNRSR
jgi:hypothetical protein